MADQLDPQTLLDNIRGQNQQQPSTQPAQQTPTPSGIDPASMLANIRASAPAAPVQQQSPSSKSGWLSGLWDSTFGALTHAPEILGSVVSPIGIMGVNTPGTPSPVIAKAVTNAPASADLIKKEGALGVAKQLPFVSQAIQNYNDLEDPNSRSYGVGEAIGNAGMLLAPFAGKIPIVRDVVIPAAYMGGDAVLGGLKSSPLYAGKLLDGLKLASSSALDSITGLSKDPAELTIQALRGSVPKNRTNFKFNLQQSIPDIKAAESAYGKPIEGIDDLIGTPATPTDPAKPGVIQLAKEANRNLYNQYMGPHSAAGSMIDTTPVADAIEASIPAKFRQLPAYKPVVDQIIAKADGYRGKQFSIDDVDSFRGTTNDELSSYYDENPAAKRAAVGSNPKTAALDAEANALRKVQYDKLEDPNQPYVVKDIQKRYGYLSELQKSLEARRNVALRQAPQNLSEQLSKWSSIGDALRGGARFIGGLGTGQLGVAASGLGDIAGGIGKMAAAKWMKGQIQTDSLLTRAFKNATPSAPEPGPSAAFLNSVTPAATPVSPGLNPLSKQLPGTTPQTPTPLQNQMGITTGGNKAPGVGKASPTTPTVPAGISPFPAKPIPAPVAAPKPSFNPVGGQIPSASPHVAPTPLESIMGGKS